MGAIDSGIKYSGCLEASFSTRLALDFRVPGLGLSIVAAMALATLIVISLTPMPFAWRIAVVVAVAIEALWAACALLRTKAIHLDRAGRITVTTRDGRTSAGRILDGSFVAPWFTTMRWQPDGSRLSRTIPVLPDMLPGRQFRHLRVLLRWS